tara:strand:- start:8954 stop:9118 length:165 start_codon:yes stop_codon:yes gene_type:complete
MEEEENISASGIGSAVHLDSSSGGAFQNNASVLMSYFDGGVGASAIHNDDFLVA